MSLCNGLATLRVVIKNTYPDVSEALEWVIHLTRRQVGAEAVTRVIQTQERVTRQCRCQEGGEAVKTAGIVQEAVEDEPLTPALVTGLAASPLLARDGAPGHGDADLCAGDPRHAPGEGHGPPGHRGYHGHHPCSLVHQANANQGTYIQ